MQFYARDPVKSDPGRATWFSTAVLIQVFNSYSHSIRIANKEKEKHCSPRMLFLLLCVASLNNKYTCIGFSLMALSCSFWQDASVQLNMPANARPLFLACPDTISCDVSSLLLETPLSLTSLSSLGGIDALEKGPAEWNSPFWLQLGVVTWLIWGLSEM